MSEKESDKSKKLSRADRLLLIAMKRNEEAEQSKMSRSERLKLQAFKNVQDRKKTNSERLKEIPKSEKAKRMFLMNKKKKELEESEFKIQNEKKEEVTKKPFINKDSAIVSVLGITMAMVGFWYIRWNFNEIFISIVLFGGLLKLILELSGKGNKY